MAIAMSVTRGRMPETPHRNRTRASSATPDSQGPTQQSSLRVRGVMMQIGVPIGALIAGAVGTRFTREWEVPDKIDRLEKKVDLFMTQTT